MAELLVAHAFMFVGSALGGTLVTLLPYYKRVREAMEVGEPGLVFDKKFLMTALVAFVLGSIAALLAFDENAAKVNLNDTAIKIFATAFGASVLSNVAFNALIKPSHTLTTAINSLKDQNSDLKQQVQRLKSEKS